MFVACFTKTVLILYFCNLISNIELNHSDWTTVEKLAEEHPYIVAILNQDKEYVCTGTIVHKRTVLTAGRCTSQEPQYILVGTAVLGHSVNNNHLFQVASTKIHGDYVFEFQDSSDRNIARMHSNIGLVYTLRPISECFIESAPIGNYYAPELKEKKLIMIGFGSMKTSDAIVLQHQVYHQIPCKNPKWYYCVCAIEYADISYDEPFGEGAPVLYDDKIVGIAVSPSGTLDLKPNIIYNIFTVIGPYLAWIEKFKSESVVELRTAVVSKSGVQKIFIFESLVYVIFTFFIKGFVE